MTYIVRSARDVHFFALVPFVLALFRFCFIIVMKDFPLSSKERISSAPFFDLHHTTQAYIVFASSSQLAISCNHITTVGLSFSHQKSRSPRPTD